MARYISDQNKVVLLHESGTYSNPSGPGFWPGQVQSNTIKDQENFITNRFLGTTSRSLGTIEKGPRDVTGTLTYRPQDMRLVFWSIGSVRDTSGTTSVHTATQIDTNVRQSAFTSGPLNPPISFTLEDSKTVVGTGTNFIRTINGCVPNSATINLSQGDVVQVDLDYVGQTMTYSSGTTTALTAATINPYLWSDSTITFAGSPLNSVKSLKFNVNQNIVGPHYLNGSRDISVPFPQNREYTMDLNTDWASEDAKMLYSLFYKSNGSFNATIDLNKDVTAVGSQHAQFVLSGCFIMNPDLPSPREGVNNVTLNITAQNVSATEWTSAAYNSTFNPF